EKDLVAVSVSPDDGRQRKYGLTARGTRTMARLRAARQDAIDAIWMDLDPAHVRAFTRFAQKLSDRLARALHRPASRTPAASMGRTRYEKVFDQHAVRQLPSGQYQLLMGLHLIHEVTSPQAFAMLRDRGLGVPYPERTFATVDHIIPTHDQRRPLADSLAEEMFQHLE